MILVFVDWKISAQKESYLGYQYDNLTRELVVQGDLPEGWEWDVLVNAGGNGDIWPLTLGNEQASIELTDDNLSVQGEYYLQLRGTNGDLVRHTNIVTAYNSRSLSGIGQWPTIPTEWIQAENDIKELNSHPPIPGENGYWMLWDLSTHSYVTSQLVVPGLTIKISDTITGDPGTNASVENLGTSTAPNLQFTIPRGDEGKAATIEVGEVTASDPGSEPQVTNAGTENAAVFNFVLPRGQTGPTGQAATVEVEGTVTGQPGTQANVENVGTTGAAKLRFTIPQGPQGIQGNPGADAPVPKITVKETTTLPADSPATVKVEGNSPNFEFSFGIPQGVQGNQGIQGEQGIPGKEGIQGPVGPVGPTPDITVAVTGLEYNQPPTVNKTGNPENPVFTIGIPQGQPGQNGVPGEDGATPTISIGTVESLEPSQNPTASITGETPNLTLNLGIPKGQPGEDGVQINDEAVNTTETWSSKKLLDTLCPPFTETGNPITCNPVEDYPLDVTVTMEPIQEGEGDPSPDNVRPISGRDSVKVTVANEDESHDYTLTMPETIYGGTVDAVTGVGSKTWKYVKFDGTENWRLSGKNILMYFYDIDCLVDLDGLCSHFPYEVSARGSGMYVLSSGTVLTVSLGEQLSSQYTIETWKSYLAAQYAAGTPVTVCYKLATPEPFQATGNQPIPALAGENTVYTDADSLTVNGRTDPLSTIQTMQAQITTLQDQATQGGTA